MELGRTSVECPANWMNMADVEYFPANQQRGFPGRATLTLKTRF